MLSYEASSLYLSTFDVDPERGFLPSPDPLVVQPAHFAFPDERGQNLPCLLAAGRLRPILDVLEPANVDALEAPEAARAYMLYAFLASAYIHALGEEPAKRIPRGVAVPLYRLAQRLGKPANLVPILFHDGYVPHNWRRRDPAGPIALDNLDTLVTFSGLPDESWFILVHTEIEAHAAPAIRAIWADSYINQKVADPRGSGGTLFMEWLAQLRDEILRTKLPG